MRRAALSLLAAAALLAAGADAATRTAHTLSATMTPARVVTPGGRPRTVPPALVRARGRLTARLAANGRTLSWTVSYANLGASRLVVADVHAGAAGRFGPITVRLCGPCADGQRGVARLGRAAARALATGPQVVTLATDRYPNGAVRGQLRTR
jgi:CHRD domain-containing protein